MVEKVKLRSKSKPKATPDMKKRTLRKAYEVKKAAVITIIEEDLEPKEVFKRKMTVKPKLYTMVTQEISPKVTIEAATEAEDYLTEEGVGLLQARLKNKDSDPIPEAGTVAGSSVKIFMEGAFGGAFQDAEDTSSKGISPIHKIVHISSSSTSTSSPSPSPKDDQPKPLQTVLPT